MTGGKRPTVRGRAERAICPKCGRNTAAMWNADMTAQRMTSTYLLHPHNVGPGVRCKGWIVGKANMASREPTPPPPHPSA